MEGSGELHRGVEVVAPRLATVVAGRAGARRASRPDLVVTPRGALVLRRARERRTRVRGGGEVGEARGADDDIDDVVLARETHHSNLNHLGIHASLSSAVKGFLTAVASNGIEPSRAIIRRHHARRRHLSKFLPTGVEGTHRV